METVQKGVAEVDMQWNLHCYLNYGSVSAVVGEVRKREREGDSGWEVSSVELCISLLIHQGLPWPGF